MAHSFDITPLDVTFGAIISGVKVTTIDDAAFRDLYATWLKYALLIFPDQHLSRDQQIGFAKRFGNLEFEFAPISNVKADGTLINETDHSDLLKILQGNMGWHCDSTYMPVQAKGAVFSAVTVPRVGGETGWADMRAAYDALDDRMRGRVERLAAHHSLRYSQAKIGHIPKEGSDYSGYGFHNGYSAALWSTGLNQSTTVNAVSRYREIVMLDALALSQAIRAKHLSCVEVMTAYLDHIEQLNPRVNAIVSLGDRNYLIAQARGRDAQLARGEYMGWMHGFPQAIKDLEATTGIRTTLGSPLFKDFIPAYDSILVERIKRAGAIIIGKTNTPEFGLGSHSYNPVFGTTLNAYDQTRAAGGSSGGAAVALALRMMAVADGSDHVGSLRNPAAFNNVLGFRTSFGRVPSDWREVFSPGLSVHGPMARKVSDLAMQLSTIAGYDARVPYSVRDDAGRFTAALERDFKGVRIAWSGDFAGCLAFEPGVLDLCESALRVFERLGCIVECAVPDYPVQQVWQNWLVLRASQVSALLKPLYLQPERRAQMKPEAQWEVERGLKLSAAEVYDASLARTNWYHAVRKLFERYDYLVMPSAQVFPFDANLHWPEEINGRSMDTYHRWMEVVIPATMSGCPALNVPAGLSKKGLPMGIQIIAPNLDEFACLQLALAYERETEWADKVPPVLLSKLETD